MSSSSTGFRWILTALLIAALSDGCFAISAIRPPIAMGALLDPTPIQPTGNAATDKLVTEAEAAFDGRNYDAAIVKIRELLTKVGDTDKTAPLELLYFKIGLANLLGDRNTEAETAFSDCIKRFPKGEYTSRCYLGLGRACMREGDPQIKWRAVATLKNAAQDPWCRPVAILWLGEVYSDFGKHDEALAAYRDFIGSEVRTMQQTSAAVAVVGVLADQGRLDELELQIGSFVRQTGVRDSIAWFTDQMVVVGDELVAGGVYQPALAIYRSVLSRDELLEIQRGALEKMRGRLVSLESRVKAEANTPLARRSNAPHLLANLKSTIEQAETAMKAIEEKTDLDAALLMRRGRCLFHLDRHDEALVCFRTIRTRYPTAIDAGNSAYAEIVVLNALGNLSGIGERCDEFIRKYPRSENAGQVADLAGELLVRTGNWKEIGEYHRRIEAAFPNSGRIDFYVYLQGLACFKNGDFKEAASQFERLIRTYPHSPLVPNTHYRHAAAYLLGCGPDRILESIGEYCAKYTDGKFETANNSRPAKRGFVCGDTVGFKKGIAGYIAELGNRPEHPANESIEHLIDELVKILVHGGEQAGAGYEATDKSLVALLRNCECDKDGNGAKARIAYGRSRLAAAFKRTDLETLFLNERAGLLGPSAPEPGHATREGSQ